MPLDVAGWSLDVVYSCSQKGLGAPSGVAPIVFAPSALARRVACRSFCIRSDAARGLLGSPPVSPHHVRVAHLRIREALMMVEEEGLKARWARHERIIWRWWPDSRRWGSRCCRRRRTAVDTERRARASGRRRSCGSATPAAALQHRDRCRARSVDGKIWRIGLMGTSSTEALVTLCLAALEKSLRGIEAWNMSRTGGLVRRSRPPEEYTDDHARPGPTRACGGTDRLRDQPRHRQARAFADERSAGNRHRPAVRRRGPPRDGRLRRPELQRYVSDIGIASRKLSHRPHLPWTFTVVDHPAINAFALPGGFIYITRGHPAVSGRRGGVGRRAGPRDRACHRAARRAAVHARDRRQARSHRARHLRARDAAVRRPRVAWRSASPS